MSSVDHARRRLLPVHLLYGLLTVLSADSSIFSLLKNRPIIFVAHSLGGIILKAALLQSDRARAGAQEHNRSIKTSTYGILFLGTPHQGGEHVPLGKFFSNFCKIYTSTTNVLLQHLEQNSEYLQTQMSDFSAISNPFKMIFAYEEYATCLQSNMHVMVSLHAVIHRTPANIQQIVPKSSAVVPGAADAEPIKISADHISMVKFHSEYDTGYKAIISRLKDWSIEAGTKINENWQAESGVPSMSGTWS